MKRRDFIKKTALAVIGFGNTLNASNFFNKNTLTSYIDDKYIKDGVLKSPKKIQTKDLIIDKEEFEQLKKINTKLVEARRIVGYGKYNLLSFDECVLCLKNYGRLGNFTKEEKGKIEELFTNNANIYGFFGKKVLNHLTYSFKARDLIKVPHTGHYLFKGRSLLLYEKLRKQVGKNIILTSGVRGIIKQVQLFLSKAISTNGNLSLASRSLAPPGYSYHGVGDFDVGKVGFGYKNFTEYFENTDIYKKLIDLGYVQIRYTKQNPFGVRYEPWHIKVSR